VPELALIPLLGVVELPELLPLAPRLASSLPDAELSAESDAEPDDAAPDSVLAEASSP
jgi:hypothetical protein